jgi:hypothetical protein
MGTQLTSPYSSKANQPESQTMAASAAPRMGQKRKSAYKRMLGRKTKFAREAGYARHFGQKRRVMP